MFSRVKVKRVQSGNSARRCNPTRSRGVRGTSPVSALPLPFLVGATSARLAIRSAIFSAADFGGRFESKGTTFEQQPGHKSGRYTGGKSKISGIAPQRTLAPERRRRARRARDPRPVFAVQASHRTCTQELSSSARRQLEESAPGICLRSGGIAAKSARARAGHRIRGCEAYLGARSLHRACHGPLQLLCGRTVSRRYMPRCALARGSLPEMKSCRAARRERMSL